MIANDVNVIFAFHDVEDAHHRRTMLSLSANARRQYVMLANVLKSFIHTYKNYIIDVGAIIEHQIDVFTQQRAHSPVKEPSSGFIAKMVESGIDSELQGLSATTSRSLDSLQRFKELLLTEYSLPELYFEEKSMGDFREKFIEKGEALAIEAINTFAARFKKIMTMKINSYRSYDSFLQKINMPDYEDRRICAELFCFGKERGKIGFLTFDRDFKAYLKRDGPRNNVEVMNC